jgi:hypothetical protein
MYGMITDAAGFFPRGIEGGGANRVSSGPVGNPALRPQFAWDTDTTYGDWYAAHEIAHSLGRAHPVAGAADDPATPVVELACGHSADDGGYPYTNAELSPAGGAFAGFDVGDRDLRLNLRFLDGNVGHDFMSYCNEQWISDYTYRALYQQMMGTPLTPAPDPAGLVPAGPPEPRIPGTVFVDRPRLAGDFLSVTGFIVPTADVASLLAVQHRSEVASIPAITPGPYAIRQVNGSGGALRIDAFTPSAAQDAAGILTFHQVVDYAPGAASIQVVRLLDSAVLGSYSLSPNPPAVSNVVLASPPDPVTGTVTLTWNAGDPDGDALAFDVLYSRDGGQTFIPLQLGVNGDSAQVDTAQLSGSIAAVFQVRASDGTHLASANSPAFAMASKPPTVRILLPEDGQHFQFGTWFNLEADGDDPQDGSEVAYSWATQVATFATGRRVTIASIGTGAQTITVTATNSQGLSATDSVTVHVGDDLDLPGPTLSAGPEQLSFHAPAGSSTVLTATVTIANVGSGALTWGASANAAWLSLNAAGGAAPATLTVSANPAGLPPNTTYTATVTISAAAGGSPINIPVALSIGNVWLPPANSPQLYLPLILFP